MALSTIQRVALFSGLVLCVSLLLPKTFLSRGKQPGPQEGSPGRLSPLPHGKPTDGRAAGHFFPRSHLSEAVSKAKTGGGAGGGRQSLVGQIIPIYGFGILLYILYILFKLSSKGKNTALEPQSTPIANGNLKRKITDYELSQLQDKLRETEEAMEEMISRLGPNSDRAEDVSRAEEQQLLQRLKEITRVMQEGKPMDGVSPEQEAEEAPYMENWEGYPEETFPIYDPADARRRHDTIFVERSALSQPTAEEIAEQMEFVEDYSRLYAEEQAEYTTGAEEHGGAWGDSEEEEEEDPAVIAENAGFTSDREEEEPCEGGSFIHPSGDGGAPGSMDHPNRHHTGSVRKRSKNSPEP